MKKKLILSAVLTMILCFCLIGGATFALFTSESNVNIAVTSGKVNVVAEVTEYKVYSMEVEQTLEVDSKKVFENGGTAQYNGGVLTLDRITPGDKVELTITITNNSNIHIKYRVKWINSGDLYDALDAYIIGENNTKEDLNDLDWTEWNYDPQSTKKDVKVCVELPISTMDDYQLSDASISFVVEAIQKNAAGLDYVFDEEDLKEAIANGKTNIALGDDIELSETLNVDKITTINGNGFKLSRGNGFTGTMINAKANLTLKNVTVDGGAVWTGDINPTLGRGNENSGVVATGNLVAAGSNTSIVLGEDAILQNNCGSHAINLGTRIGATLTIDGGEVINNQSDSGAIWGGGNITLNSGKINNNSSTGLAGAIRMVSSCNLTINGGEVNNNYANGDGGVIWGYGSSTYTFTGGSMSNNVSTGTGGAIYMGTYSVTNMSGDFKLENNKAENSGAIRFTDHNTFNMTGGLISGNEDENGCPLNTWNLTINLSGGEIRDNFNIVGGLGATIGKVNYTGEIFFDLSTNHNTAYLDKEFNSFKFKVNEANANFAQFNFKPAADYTYVEGDEDKLVCLNQGYETYWDATTKTFRLQTTN